MLGWISWFSSWKWTRVTWYIECWEEKL